jgi:hypothetical protein
MILYVYMYIFMYTYIYIIVNRFIQIHYSAFFLSLGSVREDRSFIVFDVDPATLILRKGAATQNFSMEVHHFEHGLTVSTLYIHYI